MPRARFSYFNLIDLLVPIVSIILGFVVGMILIALAGKNPFGAYGAMFSGAFGSIGNISEAILKTAILTFTGLSVAFAYKVGLFNIGAEGQFIVGAITAAFLGHWVHLPSYLHIPLILVASFLMGGLWAAIAGWLKVSRGVHEVISTIMLNWVAIYLVEAWLVTGPLSAVAESGSNTAGTPIIDTSAQLWRFIAYPPDQAGRIALIAIILLIGTLIAHYILNHGHLTKTMNWVFSLVVGAGVTGLSTFAIMRWQYGILGARVDIGIFIALAAVVVTYFLLYRTVLGYEIRATGYNQEAARYAGINVKQRTVLTMFIAGGLAGVAGMLMVCGTEKRFPGVFPGGYGFDGIAMALIGQNSPIGTFLASVLFGIIRGGATSMQLPPYEIHKTFADIIQGSVVLFIAANNIIRYLLMLPIRRKEEVG
jgi:ABC-type uncharacterized transport system permease subunit